MTASDYHQQIPYLSQRHVSVFRHAADMEIAVLYHATVFLRVEHCGWWLMAGTHLRGCWHYPIGIMDTRGCQQLWSMAAMLRGYAVTMMMMMIMTLFSIGLESLLSTYCVLITTRLFCTCTMCLRVCMLQNWCQLLYSCEWHWNSICWVFTVFTAWYLFSRTIILCSDSLDTTQVSVTPDDQE